MEPLAYLQRRQESSQKIDLFLDKTSQRYIIYDPQTSVLGVSAQEESSNRALLVYALGTTASRSPISSNGAYNLQKLSVTARRHDDVVDDVGRRCLVVEVIFPQ